MILMISILLLSPVLLSGNNSADESGLIDDFYNQLVVISESPVGDNAYHAKEKCKDLCIDRDYPAFPDDFYLLGLHSENKGNLIIGNYLKYFTDVACENMERFSYKIIEKSDIKEPEWIKGAETMNFTQSIVEKEYVVNGEKIAFRDTILISNIENKILGIGNMAGGYHGNNHEDDNNSSGDNYNGNSTNQNTDTPSADNTENGHVNIINLQLLAAKYYNARQYEKAYNTYLEVIMKDPANADAYYRLALMSYRREGCRRMQKRETDKKAMEYIRKAHELSKGSFKARMWNIIYYWS